jgi:hypothetical protein
LESVYFYILCKKIEVTILRLAVLLVGFGSLLDSLLLGVLLGFFLFLLFLFLSQLGSFFLFLQLLEFGLFLFSFVFALPLSPLLAG